jgi:hypothetical protein
MREVDEEYFNSLPAGEIEITADDKFYAWVDTKLTAPYDKDAGQLFQDMLEMGLGEIIDHKHFEEDVYGTEISNSEA